MRTIPLIVAAMLLGCLCWLPGCEVGQSLDGKRHGPMWPMGGDADPVAVAAAAQTGAAAGAAIGGAVAGPIGAKVGSWAGELIAGTVATILLGGGAIAARKAAVNGADAAARAAELEGERDAKEREDKSWDAGQQAVFQLLPAALAQLVGQGRGGAAGGAPVGLGAAAPAAPAGVSGG